MTLLVNEIHVFPGFKGTFQIAAADRRITRQGLFHSSRRKLFSIPYLNASISYYGMASFFINYREVFLNEWLAQFILKQVEVSHDIESFCFILKDELNKSIDPGYLERHGSGFHISCYHNNNLPDFYYLSNVSNMDGFEYRDFQPRYGDPESHFLRRDAEREFGWDGANPDSVTTSGTWLYRNGEFKEHVVADIAIDSIMNTLFSLGGYKRPT